MTLLVDIRNFFQRERPWGLFFLFIVVLYSFLLFWPGRELKEPPSEALERLRLAELKLKEEIHSVGSMKEFLAQRPGLLLAFELFTLLLLGAVVIGLILDFLWLTRPQWRSRLQEARGPPEARGWSVGTIFKIIVAFLWVSVSLHFFLFFFKAALFPKAGPNWFILAQTTVSDLACVGLVVYFVHRLGGHWQDLGFREARLWKDLGVGLAAYAAILPLFLLVLVLLALWAHFFAYEPPPHPLVEVFLEEEKRAPGLVAYSIFLACLAGPFFEEIFFRGFCYPAFKKRWGRGWALVLSAAFFGFIHLSLFAFWPIFILGVSLAYLYEKSGTLVPSIALHIVHNSLFVAYFFLAKEVLTG